MVQRFIRVFDPVAAAAHIQYVDTLPGPKQLSPLVMYGGFTAKQWQPRFEDDPNNIVRSCYSTITFDETEMVFSDEDKGEIIQGPRICASKAGKLDNRIKPIVHMQGNEHVALLDTGATHSFISPAMVAKYAIQ
ncbi:hypothetical protein BGZ83_002034, partial [Gryganskiella cystojenkinii]